MACEKNIAPVLRSEPAKDGSLYMTITLADKDYRLNSNYKPAAEAEKWASGVECAKNGAIILMFGLGSGYCIRALLARLSADAEVIVWEPSGKLRDHVIENYEISDLLSDTRLHLIVAGENDRQIYALLDQKIHWSNAKKQCLLVHPQYDRAFPEQLALFEEIVRTNNIRIYTNRNTEMHFGQSIAENVVQNLKYIPEAITLHELQDKFPADIPAIIVSAGPSLDKNIEELKKAKNRALIIAVDTALRALHAHGILPDFTVTLDAKIRLKHFQDTDFSGIPLFAKPQANCQVLKLHEAEKIWFDSHEYLNRFLRKIGRNTNDYHAGASVSTAAFSICAALGFRRIVLIGQDLAYMGDVTHVGGETSAIRAEEENICYVDAADGGRVKTRHDWLQYLKWFERVVKEVQGEIEVIDATEGGALIHGTRLMPLAEVIDRYCAGECDIAGILKQSEKKMTVQERRCFAEYLKKSIAEAAALKQMAEEICTLCENGKQQLAEWRDEQQQADRGQADRELMNKEAADMEMAETPGRTQLIRSMREQLQLQIAEKNQQISKMDFYLLADDYTKKDSIPAITEMLETEGTEEENYLICLESNQKIYRALAEAADALVPLLQNAAKEAGR